MIKKCEYLIVGSGFYGCTLAHLLHNAGKHVLVVEKRNHIGGNSYTENIEGIEVHKYGAHLFHTNNKEVWKYLNQFDSFNNYRHRVKANYNGEIYDLPFNMNTFKQMWGIETKEDAIRMIQNQSMEFYCINNLEEQCLSTIGYDIYSKLIKGYTEKQWGRDCKYLPPSIIKRIPIRFEFNNDYFDDLYQGVPDHGYTYIMEKMLKGIEVIIDYDFLKHRGEVEYKQLIFTGPIDEFFDYKFGHLEYRSVRFDTKLLDQEYYQDNSVINYTDRETPFTRIIEHKYFNNTKSEKTLISFEFPVEGFINNEPYYPINDKRNDALYKRYKEYSENFLEITFGGRLGDYKYYNMDEAIYCALETSKRLLNE